MCMATELEIDSCLGDSIYLEGCMVEQDRGIFFFVFWEIYDRFCDIFPHSWFWVVDPDDVESVDRHDLISEDLRFGILE